MKKFLSLILAILLVITAISAFSVSAENDYDELFGLPEIKEGYHRYYLLVPDDWFWDESVTAGIYWDKGTDAPKSWPGYKAHKADTDDIYYFDVPADVEQIIWNNFYEGADISSAITRYNKRTDYLPTKDVEHQVSYNRMIAVVNKSNFDDTNLSYDYPACKWYCYYGGGEYGTNTTPTDKDTYRYYFYLPEGWSAKVYIYWYNGTNAQSDYPGYEAYKTHINGLYYYDVPKDVEQICWNNIKAGSIDFACYPETYNNHNKVYVLDFDKRSEYSSIYYGDWYYYYGNGEYGLAKDKTEGFYTCRSFGGKNPAPKLPTNRYYFYMPNDWENELTKEAKIYWWEGTNSCTTWPGYKAKETDIDGLYCYDVPKDVTSIIWNNHINGGYNPDNDIYKLAKKSTNIGTEYYEKGESELYPEGLASFDEMVYVINYDKTDYNSFETSLVGEWYYYYGGGEYGTTPEKGNVVYTERYFGTAPTALGDANHDGKVNIKDATAIQKHLANLIALTETDKTAADFNGDGEITIKDATAIQKYLAKI
ncbi:MAG: hypothetical protein IKK10_03375 [Clostridia bacterium]|nr:hypothetical protein [Clostridia bacterium]